jgi:uncharacterized protein DUF3618
VTAARAHRTPEQIRADIEAERQELAVAVEHLRDSLGEATNIAAKLKGKLPLVAGGAASVGFVLGGGIGATMRYLARRGRERPERARVGRFSIIERD